MSESLCPLLFTTNLELIAWLQWHPDVSVRRPWELLGERFEVYDSVRRVALGPFPSFEHAARAAIEWRNVRHD